MSKPREFHRKGKFFVTLLGHWWLVCEDSVDPENPIVLRQCAMSPTAVQTVNELAGMQTEAERNRYLVEQGC